MLNRFVVTNGFKKGLHTTASGNRQSTARSFLNQFPSTSTPTSTSSSSSAAAARSRTPWKPLKPMKKPYQPYRKPTNLTGTRRAGGGGPSSISSEQLELKLVQHLKSTWSNPAPSRQLRQLANDLGVDLRQLADLGRHFATVGIEGVQRDRPEGRQSVITWDWETLRSSYIAEGPDALWDASLATFLAFVKSTIPLQQPSSSSSSPRTNATVSMLHELATVADHRYFYETYPAARQQRRKLILHVGPTNSGKTYSALVALARARTGAYAGPLRLLAHEVFSRFNQGLIGREPARSCNLITGEEQRIVDPEAGLISCTVEMFPMSRRLDVGVVDEIQMIGDPQRGSAWTQAVVGSLCKELHLCGEESVVELVQTIAREMGDECIVKRYQRLSPLTVANYSLEGDLKRIRKGDCLVTFSRSNIFMFKRQIESKTGLKVAVAYGGLPPEVREEQARAFNAGEYDVLVASDAVGMGLNLKIRRIVFESLHKWDGTAEVRLSTPQIKQLAGRAGRYGVHAPVSPSAPDLDLDPSAPPPAAEPDSVNGEATTLDAEDLPILQAAMQEPTVQVTQASTIPPFESFKELYQLLPASTRMSRLFSLARSILRTKSHYRSTGSESFGSVGDKIAEIHPLTFQERYTFGSAPVNLRDNQVVDSLVGFVRSFAQGKPILMEEWASQVGLFAKLDEIDEAKELKRSIGGSTVRVGLPEGKAGEGPKEGGASSEVESAFAKQRLAAVFSPTTLQSLESFHRCLTLYLWLSYRLAPIFSDQTRARELRQKIEKSIEFVLEGIRFERVERGKGSKRNKAQFFAEEVRTGVARRVLDQFGRFQARG